MEQYTLLLSVFAGIAVLLFLILYLKLHAFLALFISSTVVGLLAGIPVTGIMGHLQKGMGDTLGFVATVVGLGSMFGALLEYSGGAQSLAAALVKVSGEKNASWAMALTGFIVSIPVFFDVAFIILIPVVYALQKNTGRSLLLFGIPLAAGLAVSHAFIPPTPGPVAVAEIIGADMGWTILTGIAAGIPAMIVAGPLFGKIISEKIRPQTPFYEAPEGDIKTFPSAGIIAFLIGIPIILIIVNSLVSSPLAASLHLSAKASEWLRMIGHPFMALIIANIVAWYLLGIRKGYSKEKLLKITGDSLAPAGIIILITGAGGMFKQVLTGTGAGKMLAEAMSGMGISYLVFAFLIAAVIRILQGSATVAMITAAGMTASLIQGLSLGSLEKALIVTSIASGASILSHVNDSGFWLVSRYLGLSEKETFLSWSIASTLVALTGFAAVLLLHLFFV